MRRRCPTIQLFVTSIRIGKTLKLLSSGVVDCAQAKPLGPLLSQRAVTGPHIRRCQDSAPSFVTLPHLVPRRMPHTARLDRFISPTASCRQHDLFCVRRLADQQNASSLLRPAHVFVLLTFGDAPTSRLQANFGTSPTDKAFFCSALPLSITRPGIPPILSTRD